jgi:acetylornithine/succinyldiaminopimelate/putrescine aminotransferase
MILAKGLGYGVPIGAFLSKENAMALTYGDHGSTFGGNPLTTAAAAAGTRYLLDNDVLGNVKRMEVVLNDKLNGLKARYGFVEEIRCKGLLAAVQFDSDIMPAVMDAAEAAGVLLNGVRPNAVRIMPALNITEDEIDEGVQPAERGAGQRVVRTAVRVDAGGVPIGMPPASWLQKIAKRSHHDDRLASRAALPGSHRWVGGADRL